MFFRKAEAHAQSKDLCQLIRGRQCRSYPIQLSVKVKDCG